MFDTVDGRKGEWMQTSMGGKFFPEDPRPEDFTMSDIANGLALDVRYAGQGEIYRYYSTAEHSYHMAEYMLRQDYAPDACMLALLHDAPESFLNDLARAVKHAVGVSYAVLERKFEDVIFAKYGLIQTNHQYHKTIKEIDQRIVPLEKAAIMRYPQPWAFDKFEALEGVTIRCWDAPTAKEVFLNQYDELCERMGVTPEKWEI